MLTMLLGLLFAPPAFSQDTVEIGVIRDEDIHVVQRMLYPKEQRSELGLHLGVMPFDAYLTTPNGQLTFDYHLNEGLAIAVAAGGGYGLSTPTLTELQSPVYNVSPDAYRYLGSALVGVQWSPIYAKMNLNGARVVHYDLYATAKGGVSYEQSILPKGGSTMAPTISLGLGSRFFTAGRATIRAEVRDDVLIEPRQLTSDIYIKQNINMLVGVTLLSKIKGR